MLRLNHIRFSVALLILFFLSSCTSDNVVNTHNCRVDKMRYSVDDADYEVDYNYNYNSDGALKGIVYEDSSFYRVEYENGKLSIATYYSSAEEYEQKYYYATNEIIVVIAHLKDVEKPNDTVKFILDAEGKILGMQRRDALHNLYTTSYFWSEGNIVKTSDSNSTLMDSFRYYDGHINPFQQMGLIELNPLKTSKNNCNRLSNGVFDYYSFVLTYQADYPVTWYIGAINAEEIYAHLTYENCF
jgi:hypothetical protein